MPMTITMVRSGSDFRTASGRSMVRSVSAGQAVAGAQDGLVRFSGVGIERGEVTHLAAVPRGEFSVEVELHAGEGEGGGPVGFAIRPEIAEEVGHGRGAMHGGGTKRQSADGAKLLLELAGDAGIHGEVAGVVRARGELVDQQAVVARDEELDAEHADDAELFEDAAGHLNSLFRYTRRHARGR